MNVAVLFRIVWRGIDAIGQSEGLFYTGGGDFHLFKKRTGSDDG